MTFRHQDENQECMPQGYNFNLISTLMKINRTQMKLKQKINYN